MDAFPVPTGTVKNFHPKFCQKMPICLAYENHCDNQPTSSGYMYHFSNGLSTSKSSCRPLRVAKIIHGITGIWYLLKSTFWTLWKYLLFVDPMSRICFSFSLQFSFLFPWNLPRPGQGKIKSNNSLASDPDIIFLQPKNVADLKFYHCQCCHLSEWQVPTIAFYRQCKDYFQPQCVTIVASWKFYDSLLIYFFSLISSSKDFVSATKSFQKFYDCYDWFLSLVQRSHFLNNIVTVNYAGVYGFPNL